MRQQTPRDEPGGEHPEQPDRPDRARDANPDVVAEADDPDPYAREFAIDELTGPGDED
ncbi:MAG: hypothetical protein J2P15_06550 [Micromonosporaceae bacterium]|nr:hypothetical protein [Micromonosporaceae bacterium]